MEEINEGGAPGDFWPLYPMDEAIEKFRQAIEVEAANLSDSSDASSRNIAVRLREFAALPDTDFQGRVETWLKREHPEWIGHYRTTEAQRLQFGIEFVRALMEDRL